MRSSRFLGYRQSDDAWKEDEVVKNPSTSCMQIIESVVICIGFPIKDKEQVSRHERNNTN
jgi:hypothetical protein